MFRFEMKLWILPFEKTRTMNQYKFVYSQPTDFLSRYISDCIVGSTMGISLLGSLLVRINNYL